MLNNVSKNMGRVNSSVVSMASAMRTLPSAVTGVLGPMGALVGGMGAVGIAVTGLAVGLSFGINKLKAMREESRKSREATESLQNRLILSGFSADDATSSVDGLRGSLNKLAFQTLPQLDFEMQGFIARMDDATRTRFGDLIDLLVEMGIEPVAATKAIAEAMRTNFGPIQALLGTPINTLEDFGDAMLRVRTDAAAMAEPLIAILARAVRGTQPFTEAMEDLRQGVERDIEGAGDVFKDNSEVIKGLLDGMTGDQRESVRRNALFFLEGGENAKAFGFAYGEAINSIQESIDQGREDVKTYTGTVEEETAAAIAAWDGVDDGVKRVLENLASQYRDGEIQLVQFRNRVQLLLNQATAFAGRFPGDATGALQTIIESTQPGAQRPTVRRPQPGRPIGFDPGIPGDPRNVSPFSGGIGFDPGIPGDPRNRRVIGPIIVGGVEVIRRMVINVLNDEVESVEPSLGLN